MLRYPMQAIGGLVFMFILQLTPSISHAVVNIEAVRIQTPKDGLSGQLDFSVSGQSGNTDKVSATFGSRLQWHQDKIDNFFILNKAYGESAGAKDTDKLFLHGRHIRKLRPRLAGEGFLQFEQDKFTRLSYRRLAGGGVRLTLAEQPDRKVSYLGLGAFYSEEKLEPRTGTSDDGKEVLWRANIYFVFKYRYNEQVRAASTTYYQPSFKDIDDYRLLEEAALLVKLNNNLHLKLSLTITRDNRPPQLVGKTDTIYSTGVEYSF